MSRSTRLPSALDAANAHRADELDSDPSSDETWDAVDTGLVVPELLDGLPEQERAVVSLRFYGELSQSQIAERIGVSQMQVSRLLLPCPDETPHRDRRRLTESESGRGPPDGRGGRVNLGQRAALTCSFPTPPWRRAPKEQSSTHTETSRHHHPDGPDRHSDPHPREGRM